MRRFVFLGFELLLLLGIGVCVYSQIVGDVGGYVSYALWLLFAVCRGFDLRDYTGGGKYTDSRQAVYAAVGIWIAGIVIVMKIVEHGLLRWSLLTQDWVGLVVFLTG